MQPGGLQPEEGTHPVGSRLLSYRLDNNGAMPTRMKSFCSWNLSSWTSTSAQDYRLRRCKRLLKQGPICLQETKWKGSEPEALYHAYTPAIAFNERVSTGGVAVLFPPGWQMLEEIELVKGRCVAALVQDRTCKFYVISVYIHPDNRSGDMEALLRAWRFLEKKSDYAFVAGDFNGIDKHHPQLWEKFLLQFQRSDVYPELATFRHARGVSCLDRGLVPDSLTNSSKLFATASVLVSHVANGHDIVKIRINVRPNVLNSPCHPKHEVIPSGVFMPGKDGTPISSTSELQSLVRLLHREHGRLFSEWHCEESPSGISSPPPPVTGCCSPLDSRLECTLICPTPPPPVTGRCSAPDGWGERALTCPGYSCSAYQQNRKPDPVLEDVERKREDENLTPPEEALSQFSGYEIRPSRKIVPKEPAGPPPAHLRRPAEPALPPDVRDPPAVPCPASAAARPVQPDFQLRTAGHWRWNGNFGDWVWEQQFDPLETDPYSPYFRPSDSTLNNWMGHGWVDWTARFGYRNY